MALFILRFWPVFIPLLVYIIWMIRVRKVARKVGDPLPDFRDGPWFWALIATLCVAVIMFISLGLSKESVTGEYVPPHVEDGKMIPGKVQ